MVGQPGLLIKFSLHVRILFAGGFVQQNIRFVALAKCSRICLKTTSALQVPLTSIKTKTPVITYVHTGVFILMVGQPGLEPRTTRL